MKPCFTANKRDVIDTNANIWCCLGPHIVRDGCAHHISTPQGHPRSVTLVDQTHIPNHIFILFTVFLADGFEYDGSFYVNIIGTDPSMTCACIDAKIWRNRFDIWRHQGDGAWLISIVRPKYSVPDTLKALHLIHNSTGNTLVKASCC